MHILTRSSTNRFKHKTETNREQNHYITTSCRTVYKYQLSINSLQSLTALGIGKGPIQTKPLISGSKCVKHHPSPLEPTPTSHHALKQIVLNPDWWP